MTYKEWADRPDLIADFRNLLNQSAMQIALSVLIDIGLPKTRYPANTPSLMENNALLNAKREGYYEFLRNLNALATEKKTPEADGSMVPWKYASEPTDE